MTDNAPEQVEIRFTSGVLDDGTTWRDVIITPGTDVRLEASAKVNGWKDIQSSPLTSQAFMSWFETKKRGIHDLTFEQFQDRALIADITARQVDPTNLPTPQHTPPRGTSAPGDEQQ